MALLNGAKILNAVEDLDQEQDGAFSTQDIIKQVILNQGGSVGEELTATELNEALEEKTDLTKSTAYRQITKFVERDILELVEDSNPKKYRKV